MKPDRTHARIALPLSILSLATAFGPGSWVLAQERGPSTVVMAEEPVTLDAVGLEVQIPDGAASFHADRGDVPTIEISPPFAQWFLLIQAPTQQGISSQALVGGNRPVDDLTDRILDNLMASYRLDQTDTASIESRAKVLRREKGLIVAGRPASRFYVSFPEAVRRTDDSERRPETVERERIRMYTLVDAGAGRMVSFDLMCEPADQDEARLAYLAVLASAQFSANTEVAAARAIAIETTEALLSSLSAADYRAAIVQVNDRWDRLSLPAGTGLAMDDTERGYRWIRAWEGQRGEINPERREASWTEDERQEGYLVRMDGRMIDRSPAGIWTLIDTRIICFMTPDRQQEAWTATTTFRVGEEKPVVNTEFGIRNGEEMTIARRGITSNTLQPAVPPRGYLNQVEFYLLPQLLVGHEAEATYGVYAFASGDTNVRYRQFQLEASQGQAAWRLSTELGEQARSISLYDDQGDFLGSDRGDESRWTPTTREDLLDLWQRKGLPTSAR
jgi:hypothetical protein